MLIKVHSMCTEHFCRSKYEQYIKIWFIEDLNSANGTQLNGMKVTGKVVVHQQDTVRAGQKNLRISWEKAE